MKRVLLHLLGLPVWGLLIAALWTAPETDLAGRLVGTAVVWLVAVTLHALAGAEL